MKKKFFSILFLATIFMMLTTPVAAAGPSLYCLATEVKPNGNCDVTVELTGAEGIAMIQASLYYDPDLVSCAGAESGTVFGGSLAPTVNTQRDGEIVLSWDALNPLRSDGTVLLLHMHLLGEEPAELFFGGDDDLVLAREDFEPLEVSCIGCTIKKTIAATPDSTAPVHTSAVETPTEVAVPPAVITTPAVQTTAAPESVSPIHAPAVEATTHAEEPQAVSVSPTGRPIATSVASVDSPPTIVTVEPTPMPVLTHGESNGLTVQNEHITVSPGDTQELTVEQAETTLYWSSSDERVATVNDNGIVTAHEEGTALITVSNEDGTAFASSAVTVIDHGQGTVEAIQPTSSPLIMPENEKKDIAKPIEPVEVKESEEEEKAQPTALPKETTEKEKDNARSESTANVEQYNSNLPIEVVLSTLVCFLVAFFVFRKLQIKKKTTEEEK